MGPKILGDSTGLTGFWVIFSITIFGGIFGVPGMIVGVPIFAIIYAAIKALVLSSLEAKNLPLDTETYIKLGKVDASGLHEYTSEELKNVKNLQLNTNKNNGKSANSTNLQIDNANKNVQTSDVEHLEKSTEEE